VSATVHRRSPIVTVELQLWPPPPKTATPYWWGIDTLTFYRRGMDGDVHGKVWERNFEGIHNPFGAAEREHRSASVRLDKAYGWILVLKVSHGSARRILEGRVPESWPVVFHPVAEAVKA
jgi:hypothetical protein